MFQYLAPWPSTSCIGSARHERSARLHTPIRTSMSDALKRFAPYLIALAVFLALPLIFLSPLLEGQKLAQSDHISWEAMSKELRDHRAETGDQAYWTNSMFSGMPGYFINGRYPFHLTKSTIRFINNTIPQPAGVMTLLMLGFYILGLSAGVRSWTALAGAIGFGMMSYSIISLEAGHANKIVAVAMMPIILGGLILLMRKRYLLGLTVFTAGLALQFGTTHFQIIYYTIFLCAAYVIYAVVRSLRQRETTHLLKIGGLAAAGVVLSVGANFTSIYTSQVYSDETMRGGRSALAEASSEAATEEVRVLGIPVTVETGSGLEKDYAQAWSMGPAESLTMLLPSFRGGGMGRTYENTEFHQQIVPALQRQGLSAEDAARQVAGLFYWGPQRFTSGPNYMGTVVLFLFALGFAVYAGRDRWWVLGLFIAALFLSWGQYFDVFNNVFFYLVPMYDKFRAPSMILALPSLLTAYLAIRVLHQLATNGLDDAAWKRVLYVAGGLVAVLVLFGMTGLAGDFTGSRDAQLAQQGWPTDQLMDSRQALLRADALRGLFFLAASVGALFLLKTGRLKQRGLALAFAALILVDFWTVNARYFNGADFVRKGRYEQVFQPSQALAQVAQDPDIHFRVLNLAANTFNDAMTSYHVKSIGGYHAAKLIRYQDIIENQLAAEIGGLRNFINERKPDRAMLSAAMENFETINMLNGKYVVLGEQQVIRNDKAFGPAWVVDDVVNTETPREAMNALDATDLRRAAVVQTSDVNDLNLTGDALSSSIQLTAYEPDELTYTADVSGGSVLAVFSEVYYEGSGHDWTATVDGEPVDIIRCNYLLRGVELPAGQHEIVMRFDPRTVRVGTPVTAISSIVLLLLLGGSVYRLTTRAGDTSGTDV